MDENIRFIALIDALKAQGQVSDYVRLAATLDTNKAGISDIKAGRKKISIDLLRRLKLSYPTANIEWVIMGVGEMLLPDPEHPKKQNQAAPSFLLDMIKEKDQILREQSEELGQLREQLAQARRKIEQLRSEKNENIIAQVHTQTAPAVAP